MGLGSGQSDFPAGRWGRVVCATHTHARDPDPGDDGTPRAEQAVTTAHGDDPDNGGGNADNDRSESGEGPSELRPPRGSGRRPEDTSPTDNGAALMPTTHGPESL
jgi:hypothetical protein